MVGVSHTLPGNPGFILIGAILWQAWVAIDLVGASFALYCSIKQRQAQHQGLEKSVIYRSVHCTFKKKPESTELGAGLLGNFRSKM